MSGIKSHVLHGASAVMKASTWPVACASGVYFPGDKNWSKYGFYMGFPASMKGDQAYSWCAAFVSWSARKAGIPTSKIPNYVYVPAGWNWFNSHGRLYLRSELAKTKFRPKPGDIVFFRKGDQHHTGIVATADNSSFSTIEGNEGNKVAAGHYLYTSTWIYGFGANS